MPSYYVGLPHIIRVGPHEIRVGVVKKIGKKNPRGQFDGDSITLRKEHQSAQDAVDTLMHEILHAIWLLAKIDAGKGDEEAIIYTMATWLTTTLFIDNPKLIVWLAGTLSEK